MNSVYNLLNIKYFIENEKNITFYLQKKTLQVSVMSYALRFEYGPI